MNFGTSKGREVVHSELETQMFAKQTFTGPALTRGHREDFD